MPTKKSQTQLFQTPLRRILYWDKKKVPQAGEIYVVIYDTIYWGATIQERNYKNWPTGEWYFHIDRDVYPVARVKLEDGVVVDWETIFEGFAPYKDGEMITYTFPNFFGWSRGELITWLAKDNIISRGRPQGKYWMMRDLCEIEG